MSSKELRRAGVLARVVSGELKLVNAAVMMGLSYRQSKRLGQRYREEGTEGLKHRSAGRGVEPKEAEEISGTSVAAGGQEVFRGGRQAVRAYVNGRAFGERRPWGSECADPAALDVVGRAMESGTEAAGASQVARTERACG